MEPPSAVQARAVDTVDTIFAVLAVDTSRAVFALSAIYAVLAVPAVFAVGVVKSALSSSDSIMKTGDTPRALRRDKLSNEHCVHAGGIEMDSGTRRTCP